MDVSDLPVPLSRIEKLWNCLITGETPDFEPLSRNEKYLMAMLDRYDISNLPAPMSRGEQLLYKIAVGETDLSDVPGYLSRYEELMKYLIENGGISEGDFEYVLYTLNQSLSTLYTTAEKPVKSAILTGQTLVNLATENSVQFTTASDWKHLKTKQKMLNTTKNYMVKFNSSHDYKGYVHLRDKATNTYITDARRNNFKKGSNVVLLGRFLESDLESFSDICITFFSDSGSATNLTITDVMLIEYQEGMENWGIPYFEGMQSVKLPVLTTVGKNLFHSDIQVFNNSNYIRTGNNIDNACDTELKPSTTYTLSWNGNNMDGKISLYSNGVKTNSIDIGWYKSSVTFTTSEVENGFSFYTRLSEDSSLTSDMSFNVQLEEGSTATTYEPYKSNILTVNEDVELRGIGDAKDELNLLTGEVTERIRENVFDGSDVENISIYDNTFTNVIWFKMLLSNEARYLNSVICDRFKTNAEWGDYEEIQNHEKSTNLFVSIKRDRLDTEDVNGFKTWLSQNPITVQYEVETELIKTVDLTVVDQDNQPTQLGTFENVTHVSLVAENLIPEVEMEVATRISTELASASPLMDDISTEQQQLNTTVDEQSNNVDATMIATTEIFEEIL